MVSDLEINQNAYGDNIPFTIRNEDGSLDNLASYSNVGLKIVSTDYVTTYISTSLTDFPSTGVANWKPTVGQLAAIPAGKVFAIINREAANLRRPTLMFSITIKKGL